MHMLKLSNVNFSIEDKQILYNINIEILKEQIVGVVGTHNSGKSSLLYAISGVHRISSGKIILNKKDITNLSIDKINRLGITTIFDHRNLFYDASVFDNIKIGYMKTLFYRLPDRIIGTNKYTSQEETIQRYVDNIVDFFSIDDCKHKNIKDMPTADQCLLVLLRAASVEPEFLLIDKPKINISEKERVTLIDYIKALHDRFKFGAIVINNDISLLSRICNRIIVMHQGRVLIEDTPESIKRNKILFTMYSDNNNFN
jgi:branched-chain amino acid transport system ATP-binding protein